MDVHFVLGTQRLLELEAQLDGVHDCAGSTTYPVSRTTLNFVKPSANKTRRVRRYTYSLRRGANCDLGVILSIHEV